MANRGAAADAAIKESQRNEKQRIRPPRTGSMTSAWEDELEKHYSGYYEGQAGLGSRFGAQLERARLGIDSTGGGGGARDAPMGMLFSLMVEGCIERVDPKYGKYLPARFSERPNPAGPKFARPLGAGVIDDLPYFGAFAAAALLTEAAIAAARELKAVRRVADAQSASSAATAAVEPLRERLEELRQEEAALEAKLRKRRGKLASARLGRVRADILRLTPPLRDIEGETAQRWYREPTSDEVHEILRRAQHTLRHGKDDEDKEAAERLLGACDTAAKLGVKRGVELYGAERQAAQGQRRRRLPTPEPKRKAFRKPPVSSHFSPADWGALVELARQHGVCPGG